MHYNHHPGNVLVCPLNWGLGHASRCIPLIEQLLHQGNRVFVASDGHSLDLLKNTFPSLTFIDLPPYRIRYSSGRSQVFAMLLNFPRIIQALIAEHRLLKDIVRRYEIDVVVSDNRFGMWNRNVHSVYITHQVMVKMPRGLRMLEKPIYLIHCSIIGRYNECFIPDAAGPDNLSGDLSHHFPLPYNASYIGLLSRFYKKTYSSDARFQCVAVVSGPEPQRTVFEKKLIKLYRNSNKKVLLVRGLPSGQPVWDTSANITVVTHLDADLLAPFLLGCQQIICRSGYSSVMDLAALNCLHKAMLIPTPGQTEQEYLAEWLVDRKKILPLHPDISNAFI